MLNNVDHVQSNESPLNVPRSILQDKITICNTNIYFLIFIAMMRDVLVFPHLESKLRLTSGDLAQ